MSGYNTNLAAEFYVLSMLHRFGADANLTLGNKKSVDISVIKEAGKSITIDVKGLAGKTGWPANNISIDKKNHYLVFVTFLGKIDNPGQVPEVYIIPSTNIKKFIYNSPNSVRSVVNLGELRKKATRFKDAWELLLK